MNNCDLILHFVDKYIMEKEKNIILQNELEQQKQALEAKFASQQAQDIFKDVAKVNDHTLIAAKVNVSGMDQLRQLADQWKEKDLSEVLVLATAPAKDKVNLIVGVSDAGIKAAGRHSGGSPYPDFTMACNLCAAH